MHGRARTGARRATGCWRRCASTRANGCIQADEAPGTFRRHRDWFLGARRACRAGPLPGDRCRSDGSRGSTASTTTCGLRSAGALDEPGEAESALRLAAVLWRFWEIRGHISEGRGWLERVIAETRDSESPQLADALAGIGVLASMQGDLEAATVYLEEALAFQQRRGDLQAIAYSFTNLANTVELLGDHERALDLYRRGISVANEMGDDRGRAFGLVNVADVESRMGDHAAARQHFEESLLAFRESGNRWGEAFALDSFGAISLRSGNTAESRRLHEEALAISRELQDYRGIARTLARLADVAIAIDNAPKAVEFLRLSLSIRRSLGDQSGIAVVVEQLAWAVRSIDPEAAARLLGAADTLRDQVRAPLPPNLRDEHDRIQILLRDELGAERFDLERNAGRSMTAEDALPTSPPSP